MTAVTWPRTFCGMRCKHLLENFSCAGAGAVRHLSMHWALKHVTCPAVTEFSPDASHLLLPCNHHAHHQALHYVNGQTTISCPNCTTGDPHGNPKAAEKAVATGVTFYRCIALHNIGLHASKQVINKHEQTYMHACICIYGLASHVGAPPAHGIPSHAMHARSS